MRTIQFFISAIVLVFAIQSAAVAQSINVSETFKKHFNETVKDVQQTEDAQEKRAILNNSFSNMITAIEHIEAKVTLTSEEQAQLQAFKSEITDRQNELNGLDGYDEVQDQDLNDFSDYSQQSMEQANRTTIVISGGTLLVIILLLILLL